MNEITDLLKAWNNGDQQALDKLMLLVDPELKKIAHAYLLNERPGNVLQTTALVNEALIKLIRENIAYENRKHFYGFIARRMRQVLVEYARRTRRPVFVDLDTVAIADERSSELLMLDEALTKLARVDERQAIIVECRYFIGLDRTEVAQLLGVSQTTIDREWSSARAWLKREMTGAAV